jgi:hypothetical protein
MSFKPIFLASALVFATVFGATSYDGCSIDIFVSFLEAFPNPSTGIWADAITAAGRDNVTVHGVFYADSFEPSLFETVLSPITSTGVQLYAYRGIKSDLWNTTNLQYLRDAGVAGIAHHETNPDDRDSTRANMTAIGWNDGKILYLSMSALNASAAPSGSPGGTMDIWGRAFADASDLPAAPWTEPTTDAQEMVYANGLTDVADFCARVYTPAKEIGVEIIGGSENGRPGQDQWGSGSGNLWIDLAYPDVCEPCGSSAATSTSATAPATTTTAAPTSPETSPQSTTSPGPVETTTMMANHSTTPDISPASGLFGTVAVVASLVAVLF